MTDAEIHDMQAAIEAVRDATARSTDTIALDLIAADRRLAETIDDLPQQVWTFTIDLGRGGPAPAAVVLATRLGEVELHHADLGVVRGSTCSPTSRPVGCWPPSSIPMCEPGPCRP